MKRNRWSTGVVCILAFLMFFGADAQDRSESKRNAVISPQTVYADETLPEVECGIRGISKYGNIVLDITPEGMRDLGFEAADVIDVRIGNETIRMPVTTAYSDVDIGAFLCCMRTNSQGEEEVSLAINTGNLASETGIADIRTIDADPGYEVVWKGGFDESTKVHLSMAEKQGYAEEYQMRQITGTRTNEREDYPDLDDAEYANFREIDTTGMGSGALYRSSTPINPVLGRNKEADAQIPANHIRTIFNMVDQKYKMKSYPGYDQTNYSKCDVIALAMKVDFFSDTFGAQIAEGLRYMLNHEGPYLIHCEEGKDRTGFLAGILSSLMGADMDEIIKDYMITYYNYFGITPDSPEYAGIADGNIKKSLAKAFGLNQIEDAGSDLSAYAADYLKGIGLGGEEISTLKEKLGRDYTK